MADDEPMVGFLRGDELQNLFGKVPRGAAAEKHDAAESRRTLARRAKRRSIPEPPRYRTLERLEKQVRRQGEKQDNAARKGRALYAQLELEQRRVDEKKKQDARAPLERHRAARARAKGPEHALRELAEIAAHLGLTPTRCGELDAATAATIAFSRLHEALCRDVAARAARRGAGEHLAGVADVERGEATLIAASSTDAAQSRRMLEALWRRKAWARALPRRGLADGNTVGIAAARAPAVGDGAQDVTAPAFRRANKTTREMLSRTALADPRARAQALREELGECDRFMRATDAVVRRAQERTCARSTRLVTADHATAFDKPLASALPKGAAARRQQTGDDATQTELKKRCAAWGARRLARVFRAGAFRLQLRGLAAWCRFAQYERGLREATAFARLAAGRRLCRATSAAKVRMRKFDAVEIWRRVALGCRDVVAVAAAVEIERYARSHRARRLVEWRRRRRAATRIQTRQRQLPARVELERRVVEKRRRLAATLIQKVRRDVVACRRAHKILNRRWRYVRARTIQRRVRALQARRRVARARRRRRRRLAALAIQCLARGGHTRVRADKLRRRRRRRAAALCLQKRARGYLVRLRLSGTRAEHAAAERVQHVIRRYLTACRAWHDANRRATQVLMNCLRICVARRKLAKRAEERRIEARLKALCGKGKDPQTTSAGFLQLWYRRLVTRWVREGSSYTIQGAARAYIARRALGNLLRRRRAAAALLNRWCRGELARMDCAQEIWQLELKKAARTIQRPWRGALARRRWLVLLADREGLKAAVAAAEAEEAARPSSWDGTSEWDVSTQGPPPPGWEGREWAGGPSAPPPVVFTNYWDARADYMARQEELVGAAARVLQRSGVFYTWRAARFTACLKLQALYRTQRERRRLHALQEAVRLEKLRALAMDKLSAIRRDRKNRGRFAVKLKERRRALQLKRQQLLASILLQARARGMICREAIRRELMEAAWKRQQGLAQVREDATLVIECARRCCLAHRVLRKRRQERRAEEEEREKDRLLELALDRLKKEQEVNLLAMRVQCLFRRRRAGRSLEDRMRRLVDEERAAAARAKFDAAACCQALARGVRRRGWFARNHAQLVDSKTIRGALLRMRARQAAEVDKVTARMRHLDKFGPSDYLWSGVRDELEDGGAARQSDDAASVGVAPAEPWQEQHWSERLPVSPEKGAPGEWEEQWDDSAQATYWYNRKTGEASWVDPTQQHLLGTPER